MTDWSVISASICYPVIHLSSANPSITASSLTYSLIIRSGAKHRRFPFDCLYDLHPKAKAIRNIQEYCRRVIWSSRCKFRKPGKQKLRCESKEEEISSCNLEKDRSHHQYSSWLINAGYHFKKGISVPAVRTLPAIFQPSESVMYFR